MFQKYGLIIYGKKLFVLRSWTASACSTLISFYYVADSSEGIIATTIAFCTTVCEGSRVELDTVGRKHINIDLQYNSTAVYTGGRDPPPCPKWSQKTLGALNNMRSKMSITSPVGASSDVFLVQYRYLNRDRFSPTLCSRRGGAPV